MDRSEAPHAGHWPALDGLRAVAVLAVIGTHVGILPGGYLGVDVFFVLSGYLITSLLIAEWDARGARISFRDFYARRALRLFPALGCVLVAAALVAAMLALVNGPGDRIYAADTVGAIPWAVLFASNLGLLVHPDSFGALVHTWSLAIEEQFYLLWPAAFMLLMRRRIGRPRLAALLAALAAAEMTYRVAAAAHGYGQYRIYYGPDTHSDGLLIGCALAFWMASGRPVLADRVLRALVRVGSWAAAAVLAVLFVAGNMADGYIQIGVTVVATAVLITGILLGTAPGPVSRLLCSPRAVRIGRRSYGLYLWHVLLLGAADGLMSPFMRTFTTGPLRGLALGLVLAVVIAGSFVVAEFSYRLVELPALRFKRRFRGGDLSAAAAGAVPAPVRPDPSTRFAS